MAILTRLGRLLRADVHAALDRIEEPDALLRQAIREMDDELAQAQRRLAASEAELADLSARSTELTASLQRIGGELDLCFAAGNEALQRMLLRRRLEGERTLAQWTRRGDALAATIATMRTQLDERRRRLDALRERAAVAAPADEAHACTPPAAVTDADVELALLRERALRSAP